jgi:hypothetical protein
MTSRPMMHNNNLKYLNNRRPLTESLAYKDLDGMLKNTIHVDEFASKMGEDDDIIVLSFYTRDKQAANDLVHWFEKGYDFVLDADQSPGEIKPNRYLVYLEMRRRNAAPGQVQELLDDLGTLTEYELDDWVMVYKDKETAWSETEFRRRVPLSPREYRERHEGELNEVRIAAGLDVKRIYETDRDLRALQSAAGL